MSAKHATLTGHSLSAVLESTNSFQWQKVVVSSAFNTNNKTGAFPPDNCCTGFIAKVSYTWFPFYVIQFVKKMCTQGWRSIKINDFYCPYLAYY